jgi:hypothetical protein
MSSTRVSPKRTRSEGVRAEAHRWAGAAALCAALAAGCSTDSAVPAGDSGTSEPSAGPRPPLDLPPCEPTFASLTEDVFRGGCDGEYCHGSESPAWNLWLFAPAVKDYLVTSRAGSCRDYLLVAPGDPEHSFLYLKVARERPPCRTEQMPRGLNRLPDHSIACLKEWIANGAAD